MCFNFFKKFYICVNFPLTVAIIRLPCEEIKFILRSITELLISLQKYTASGSRLSQVSLRPIAVALAVMV
jgi:hypothetical protein